uniref:Tr-type G domain-containing protein n=1 Tax=Syphacia muris TaxID=451379 RepID=A0A0N5B0R9_9BILA
MPVLNKTAAAAAAATFLASEDEDGDIELDNSDVLSKDFLINVSLANDDSRIEKYCDYIQSLFAQGEGEAIIELGASIDGSSTDKGLTKKELEIAEQNNNEILKRINATATHLVTKQCSPDMNTAFYLVRKNLKIEDFIEVRVAVVGNVDAGKSTLLGVLTHDTLDDGRGLARKKLFRHKHEFETGRTSSVGHDILGFDINGKVVNHSDEHSGHLDWVTICQNSAKVVTFIDLAGHEKYLKTTIFGMTGHAPDYTMLMVGSNAGIIGMTKEHLSLALSLSVPVFIVVTKVDMCPEQVLNETLKNIDRLMKSPGVRKLPVAIRTIEDVVQAALHFSSGRVCPVFQVSNVLGTNLDLLRAFLNLVPLRRKLVLEAPAEFQVDDVYWVNGVGTVVSGTCLTGQISVNDNLMIGPNKVGEFVSVPIKSIHRKRMPVSHVRCGQTASFAIRKLVKKDVRKGMVLVSPLLNPSSAMQFQAEILVLHHPTTISQDYQAMVHIGSIRQTATIIKMTKDVLRTGDRDLVTFKFLKCPEYLREGSRMVFREGRTKAIGTVTKVFPFSPSSLPKPSRAKHFKRKGNYYGKKVHAVGKDDGKKYRGPREDKDKKGYKDEKISAKE